jgi:hypothetical protein
MALYPRYEYMCAVGRRASTPFPSARLTSTSLPSSLGAQRRAMSMALQLRYEYMCAVGERVHVRYSHQQDGPGLLSLPASGLRGGL